MFSHYDWDTQVFNLKDKDLYRKILHTFNDWQQPWMGRKLHGVFNKTGLFDGSVSVYVLAETEYSEGYKGYFTVNEEYRALVDKGLVDDRKYAEFCRDIKEQADTGEYFYSINIYIYHGYGVMKDKRS